jgi:hypothetical protein
MSQQRRRRHRQALGKHRDRTSRVRIPTDMKVPDNVSSITEHEEQRDG